MDSFRRFIRSLRPIKRESLFLSIPPIVIWTQHANKDPFGLTKLLNEALGATSMQVSDKATRGDEAVLQRQQKSQQPQPAYILRGHASQINTLSFSSSGRLLYSGWNSSRWRFRTRLRSIFTAVMPMDTSQSGRSKRFARSSSAKLMQGAS